MLCQEKEEGEKAAPLYQKVIDMELGYKHKQAPEYNVGTLGQAYFNLGALMDKQGKFNEAIQDMKKVIEVEPDNPDAYNYIGYSYADKGVQLDDALKYVQNAVKLDPNNSYYLDSLGWVYYRKALYPQAQDQLEKAIQFLKTKQKDDAVIYDHLAQVLVKMGHKDDAVAQWKKALELDPANKGYADNIQKNSSPDL
jgi:tetratricopeptide (TPR) repeat protein